MQEKLWKINIVQKKLLKMNIVQGNNWDAGETVRNEYGAYFKDSGRFCFITLAQGSATFTIKRAILGQIKF